jgi:hypothetical protein
MAYYIEAVIGEQQLLERHRSRFRAARVVSLKHGFALIPLTTRLRRELSRPADPDGRDAEEADRNCRQRLTAWLQDISRDGPVAHVEAEYHSNAGGQDATVWQAGEIVLGPLTATSDAINQALRVLGAPVDPSEADEFDTVGLYRHRRTDQWVKRW